MNKPMSLLYLVTGLLVSGLIFSSVAAGGKTIYSGLRSSNYGFGQDPGTAWMDKAVKNMASRFGATPCVIWIVNMWDAATTERHLSYYDANDIRAFLQVEPHGENVLTLIDTYLKKYKSHKCVMGFGVDVEWYSYGSDREEGTPVTDAVAKSWSERVRSHNSEYILFLKHFFPEYMPPTYREGLMFLSDSQEYPDIDRFLNETDSKTAWGVGYKVWAKSFTPAPAGMQFGYEADQKWWEKFNDPQKVIGDSLLKAAPNTQYVFWVDFTAKWVDWDWKTALTTPQTGTPAPFKILIQNGTVRIQNLPTEFSENCTAALFDMKGKTIIQKKLGQSNEMQLNAPVAKGCYTLKIINENQTSAHMVLIP
ncbi:MAG: T9SS type A sorting domain-containing protein [Chitinivibrionales bacterium]|nr:T9SS type A sorting domain-containing protein [Chitinivibrionales bacterium]